MSPGSSERNETPSAFASSAQIAVRWLSAALQAGRPARDGDAKRGEISIDRHSCELHPFTSELSEKRGEQGFRARHKGLLFQPLRSPVILV